jgi:hypothetical protein
VPHVPFRETPAQGTPVWSLSQGGITLHLYADGRGALVSGTEPHLPHVALTESDPGA